MINYYKLIILFILLFVVGSCSHVNKYIEKYKKSKDKDEVKIRIVDLNGNPVVTKRYVPELNLKMLEYQKRRSDLSKNNNISQRNISLKNKSDNINNNNSNLVTTRNLNQKEVEIEYDLSSSYIGSNKKNEIVKDLKNKNGNKQEKIKGIFLQIGSFSSKKSANLTLKRGQKISNGIIEESLVNNKIRYRVLLGPVKNRAAASYLRQKAAKQGYKDSFIVIKK